MRFGGLVFDDYFDLATNLIRVLIASGLVTGLFMGALMGLHYSGMRLAAVGDTLLMPGVFIARSGVLDYFQANFVLYTIPSFLMLWRWHVGQVKRRTGANKGTSM